MLWTRVVGRGKAAALKRRRACTRCDVRFTTYELAFDDGGHADADGLADLVLVRRSTLIDAAQSVLSLLKPLAGEQATKAFEQLLASLATPDR